MIGSLLAVMAVSIGYVVMSAPWQAAEPVPYIASEDASETIPPARFEIRYIANEGVLISSHNKRVLIDGLHRKYRDAYAFLPDAEREKVESATPPFEKIDLILVSHMHGDHFHPEAVGRYLTANQSTLLATSQQVVDLVAKGFPGYRAIKQRITPVTYQLKSRQPMNLAGIDVEFLGVGHGSGRHATIQNLGHVISLGGKKFLHVGDSEISPEIFDAFDLEQQSIDIALLPYWFLTNKEGQELVERYIKPKQIFALHVGPGEIETIRRQVNERFSDAIVFTTMLEKRAL